MWIYIKEHAWELFITLNYVIAFFAAVTILLNNINPTKALSYLLLLVVFPFLGLVVYYFFGQEYRKNKIFRRKNILDQQNIKQWRKALDRHEKEFPLFTKDALADKIRLVRLLQKNQDAPLTKHNHVEVLINGEAKFPRLIEDIKGATATIHMEYYIIEDDELGSKLIDLLCEKAKSGIKVKLSYDYVGSRISRHSKQKMKKAGIIFRAFMPVYFPRFAGKLNYRNHRKIIVIDGKVGYVGGMNIASRYVNNGSGLFWRDTHIRIEGEAVGSLQLHFLLNWDFVTDIDIKVDASLFPKHAVSKSTAVQIAASGPDSDWANIMEAIFTAINVADDYIYVATPYFIPNDEILTALTTASRGGVEVKLIIPKDSDSWASKYASYSFVEELLASGVHVYLYEKGFIHAKVILVDGIFTTIGTANMDYRSFTTNFEINALIYDEEVAKSTFQSFQEDFRYCEELNLDSWQGRKFSQKLKESFCRLWAPLL
ncbi:cardiolipin synthase [Leptobacterium sp. I13]|uniref:cardiolipin synthase n=1 Tax=Leptobacterium meishanense TaxID=3128904 RepID=UPI0030EEEECB